jgi:phosphatidylglycerol---prolipoprotein diacylglyceryl transferase
MHPKLVTVGSFYLPTYGVLLAIAYLTAIWWLGRKAARENLPKERIFDLSLYILASAIIGAKLLLAIVDFREYLEDPRNAMELLRSGGVFQGGLIAATAVGFWYIRKHRLPLWRVTDMAAPSIALGEAIGRWGCFAAGCCYGKQTSVPWAITFTDPFAREAVGTPLNTPLHPTQIYLSLNALFLFAVCEYFYRRKKFDGEVFWIYVLGYALTRGVIEEFRGDLVRGFVIPGVLSTAQFIGVIMALASIVMLVLLSRRARLKASQA